VSDRRIVGIAMVRDEDVFVERALRNVLEFCDELIAVDHRSRDETPRILAELAAANPDRIRFHRVDQAGKANEFLRPYVGEDVWVLGVDGDELFEPDRLRALRPRLLGGEFDEWYLIKGNMLHCDEFDAAAGTAGGWLAPPSRSITKLFNFRALERWEGQALEHLYGGRRTFRPGYSDETIYYLRDDYDWPSSPFRCLHVCFLRRSSRQPARQMTRRGLLEWGGEPRVRRAIGRLGTLVGRPPESGWKLAKYRQGPRVEVDDVAPFFSAAGRPGVPQP
jgi:glycosyltransferase involved in cell wall biosynthesis